jgi:hypothetical protein
MLKHPAFHALSGRACKALFYLASQYNGHNNGDLQATIKLARKAGWKSSANLQLAILELEHLGFVVKSRQGGRNRCNLYALTWFPVDECGGKLEIPTSRVAPNDWRNGGTGRPQVGQPDLSVGQSFACRDLAPRSLTHRWASDGESGASTSPPMDTFLDLPGAAHRPAADPASLNTFPGVRKPERSGGKATELASARRKIERLHSELPHLPLADIAKATRLPIETVQAILRGSP